MSNRAFSKIDNNFQFKTGSFFSDLFQIREDSRFYWLKLSLLLMFINFGFVFLWIFIAAFNVYQANIYVFLQVALGGINPIDTVFFGLINKGTFIFYGITSLINLPLIAWSYFYINKQFSKKMWISCFWWLTLGTISGIKEIQAEFNSLASDLFNNQFDFQTLDQAGLLSIVSHIEYYIYAMCIGLFAAFFYSILWSNNMVGGGLDYIYIYLTMKLRKPITHYTLLINIFILFIGLSLLAKNELFPDKDTLANAEADEIDMQSGVARRFILRAFAALIEIQVLFFVVNKMYPKYTISQTQVISDKKKGLSKYLATHYWRNGVVTKGKNQKGNSEKEVFLTTMSAIERKEFEDLVCHIDPKASIIHSSVEEMKGPFNFFLELNDVKKKLEKLKSKKITSNKTIVKKKKKK